MNPSRILALVLLAACGADGSGPAPPPPLVITAMTPNAAGVETGAPVTVTFNQAIDPTTLTPATFRVKLGGVPLPGAISYDAATRTAGVSAPLLPDDSYSVEVTTGVRTPADSALSANATWNFATRSWQPVTVDSAGNVGGSASLGVDGSGRRHASYGDFTNGDLKYATCATVCDAAANWQVTAVDTTGVVEHSSLAVDGSGRVHVSYYDVTNADLQYATCAAACSTAAGWQTVTVDSTGNVGSYSSLAVGGNGRLHLSYADYTNEIVKYATCAAGCATAVNWQAGTASATEPLYTALAVDANGRVHVAFWDFQDLEYATCAAACSTLANWQASTADATSGVGEYASLAVDGGGGLHMSYYNRIDGELKYATCAAACATAGNWLATTVDTAGVGEHTSVAVDGRGRVHVSYFDATNGALKYATCAVDCEEGTNWRVATVDAALPLSLSTSLAVDGSGRVHVGYFDASNLDLKYIQ